MKESAVDATASDEQTISQTDMTKHLDALWAEAKQRCQLDEGTLRIARELGLTPTSLIKNVPNKSEPWKAPVKDWIRDMYERRRGRVAGNRGSDRPETARDLDSHEQQRRDDDDRFVVMRYEQFRAAAEYVAAAFANVPAVRRVALFGSVAGSPRRESGGRRMRRTAGIHEPKDVDLAVWIDHATDLDRLRVLRSRAVNQLWEEMEFGVAHHQVDVFLIDATSGNYLGRLCCFNQCPKHKPECRAQDCGRLPFLRQHDGFVFDAESLGPARIQVLYDRNHPESGAVFDEIPF